MELYSTAAPPVSTMLLSITNSHISEQLAIKKRFTKKKLSDSK